MGKVRQDRVKRIAKDLIGRFPDRFNDDFDFNKKVVEVLTDVSSTRLRNRIAGYVTRLLSTTRPPEERS